MVFWLQCTYIHIYINRCHIPPYFTCIITCNDIWKLLAFTIGLLALVRLVFLVTRMDPKWQKMDQKMMEKNNFKWHTPWIILKSDSRILENMHRTLPLKDKIIPRTPPPPTPWGKFLNPRMTHVPVGGTFCLIMQYS